MLSSIQRIRALLDKPELVCRPLTIFRFLSQAPSTNSLTVKLPWGSTLEINPHEVIGSFIWRRGLYDLIVTETLCRLSASAEFVVDVGANIGYTSSIMAPHMSPSGRLLCFEPHPLLFERLQRNRKLWPSPEDVQLERSALSNQNGIGYLSQTADFEHNNGIARLVEKDHTNEFEVELKTLDSVGSMTNLRQIDLMKVDVEGHELQVLEGAVGFLSEKRIKHIVFEDYGEAPTAVMSYLASYGYTVFALGRTFYGPMLVSPGRRAGLYWGESPSYVATSDVEQLRARMRAPGWRCLSLWN